MPVLPILVKVSCSESGNFGLICKDFILLSVKVSNFGLDSVGQV